MTARRQLRVRVAIGNLKGGTGKSTTAVYLAVGLARAGGRVLLVDADPQASTMDWWPGPPTADLPVTAVHLPFRDLGHRLAGSDLVEDHDHLVIDTAPQHDVVLRQALLAVDELLVPVAPSPLELRRLAPTFTLAGEVDATHPVVARVLLVKVRPRTRSAAAARAMLADMGLPVMAAETRLREAYPLAWGTAPARLGDYDQVLEELTAAPAVAHAVSAP